MKKNKLICLLISVAAALVLWVYVVSVVSPELSQTIYNIPVTFSGTETLQEQGLTITDGASATIALRVTGKRTVVTQLENDNITVTVDVSKIKSAGDYNRSYTITYPNSIQPTSLTIEQKTPSTIDFTVEELETREIPVKTNFEGSMKDGYMLAGITTAFDTVSVTGTKDQVADISYAMINLDPQELDATTTQEMPYTLVNSAGEAVSTTGLVADMDRVSVTMSVAVYKELPLTVAFTAGGGATESDVNLEIDPPTVMVSGDSKVLSSLNKIILATVDLSKVEADQTVEYPIVLPDNVSNQSGTVEATVKISLSGLKTTKLKVGSIEFTNVPTGFVAQAVTQSLQASVRGSAASMEKVTSTNLRAVVDLGSVSDVAGTYTVENVTIYVDGYTDVGVLGTYSVVVNLMTEADYLATLAEATGTE
ncbi:MAG: CdaR family protein [Oscillospiraceae bacterium]|nr:CdaR family protein [Oscillospiraceae bacterium]